MIDTQEVDVVIGGGGVAGVAASVALQQIGYQVVLVEPGQNGERRLAGEVFHPPGVAGLAELGLLTAIECDAIAKIDGFSVYSDGDCIRLPYDSVPAHSRAGLCLEHRLIRERMIKAVGAIPNIIVMQGARVVGIDQSDNSRVVVDVTSKENTRRYRCKMLVGADGTPARLARLAGIAVHERRIATIIGYRVSMQNIPEPEYGSVYLGSGTPVLVYPIGGGQARVLFDVPYRNGQHATAADCLPLIEAMPAALRKEVGLAIAEQPCMSVLARAIAPESSVRGRVVLVGDAGGSCHPLTATGMTMCVSDALLLRDSLKARPDDTTAALQLYEERRRWPQSTRLALADTLRDAFIGGSPEMRVVRRGIFSHWQRSASARVATLALLSTADGRPFALLRQMIVVMVRGLIVHMQHPVSGDKATTVSMTKVLVGTLFRNIYQVLRGPRKSGRREDILALRGKPPR